MEDDSDDEEEEEEEELDAELEALMQENSELSDSEEEKGEKDTEERHDLGKKRAGKRRGYIDYESPISTIAVLVVGCWMLRIPVMYKDFTRCVCFEHGRMSLRGF